METRRRFRTRRYGAGRKKFWDDIDIIVAGGPYGRTYSGAEEEMRGF